MATELISVLPPSLAMLDLSGNQLHTLPVSITQLTGLQFLDLSCNCLERLPVQLARLDKLQLSLHGNPFLNMPPPEICAQGGDRVRRWLTKEAEVITPSPQVKLLVLGHAGAGKTSLLRSLNELLSPSRDDYEDPDPFSSNALARKVVGLIYGTKKEAIDNTSTIGIDPYSLAFETRIKFSVWDFAGQVRPVAHTLQRSD